MSDLGELQSRLITFARQRDWEQFHTPKDLAISVSIEAAELLELFQWKNSDEELDTEELEDIADEVADVLQYLLLLCARLEIDAGESVLKKLRRNEERFPEDISKGVAKPLKQRRHDDS